MDASRRDLLKAAGGIGAASTLGIGGLAAFTGGAAATAQLDVSINGTSYSGDQGDVDWLGVDIEKVMNWDGFDVPLRYIGFKHEITIEDGGETDWYVLYDKMSARLTDWSSKDDGSDGWGGPGEYIASHGGDKGDYLKGEMHANVQWAIISDGSHPADYDSVQDPVDWTANLSVSEDGVTKTRTIKWKTTLTFYTEDADGNAVQVQSDDGVPEVVGGTSFDVAVTNEESVSDGSETGSSTVG